jgi:hypothetical protein
MPNVPPFLEILQVRLGLFFAFFKDPAVAVMLGAAILLVLVILWLWLVAMRVVPLGIALQRAKENIRTVSDRSYLAADFQRVDQAVAAIWALKHAWSEFKKTLIFPRPDRQPIRSTMRPSAYLNLGGMTAAGLELPFCRAIAWYFLGFGLLVSCLSLAGAGELAPPEATALRLIPALIGLLASLLISLSVKLAAEALQHHCDQLNTLIERQFVFATPGTIAHDELGELQKQTVQLERFNADFAEEVAQSLESRVGRSLGEAVGRAVEPLARSIESVTTRTADVQLDSLRAIVAEFTQVLQGAVGREIEAAAAALRTSHQALSDMNAVIVAAGNTLGTRLDGAADHVREQVAAAARTLETSISRSAAGLEALLRDASAKMNTDMQRLFGEASAAMEGATQSFRLGLEQAGVNLQGQLTGLGGQLKDAIAQAGGTFAADLAQVPQDARTALAPLSVELGRFEDNFRLLDRRFQTQSEGFTGSITLMRELLGAFDRSATKLREAGEPVAEAVDKLNRSAQLIDASVQSIAVSHVRLREVVDALNASTAASQSLRGEFRDQLTRIDHGLTNVSKTIQDGIDGYRRNIADFVREVDRALQNPDAS